jgi:hypothetical protein
VTSLKAHFVQPFLLKSQAIIMYLSLTNLFKGLFSSGYSKKGEAPSVTEEIDDHVYIKGNPDDRGPCPGLNALANQGYL